MPDREKVINGLEQTVARLQYGSLDNVTLSECEDAVFDALALLTDTTSWIKEPNRRNHWHCEKCGSVVSLTAWLYTYCPVCGRKVIGEIKFDA